MIKFRVFYFEKHCACRILIVVCLNVVNVPAAPDIYLKPNVWVKVDHSQGQNKYFCKFTAPNLDLQYQVQWTYTSKLVRDRLLHATSFITYQSDDQFENAFVLTEGHLSAGGATRLGFTVCILFLYFIYLFNEVHVSLHYLYLFLPYSRLQSVVQYMYIIFTPLFPMHRYPLLDEHEFNR